VEVGGLRVGTDGEVSHNVLQDGLAGRAVALLEGGNSLDDHLEVRWVSRWGSLGSSGLLGLGGFRGLSWGGSLLGRAGLLGSWDTTGLLGLSRSGSSGSWGGGGSGSGSSSGFFGHFGDLEKLGV